MGETVSDLFGRPGDDSRTKMGNSRSPESLCSRGDLFGAGGRVVEIDSVVAVDLNVDQAGSDPQILIADVSGQGDISGVNFADLAIADEKINQIFSQSTPDLHCFNSIGHRATGIRRQGELCNLPYLPLGVSGSPWLVFK